MGDGAGALGHLQDQVPVLGALELGVEAPDLLDQARRRTLRWQVYICVRIRSGDQSGLKKGPEWRPRRSILSSSV